MSRIESPYSRREVLSGLAAASMVSLSSMGLRAASPANRGIIDVHAHFQAPAIRNMNMPGPMNGWSVEKQIEDMEAAGVARALLSITTPGVPATGDLARRVARETNEYAAKLGSDHGKRFGSFLCLPMDNLDTALAEVAYGMDTLKANGVCLFTSYAGKYLGDASFDPLFSELNRRKAVVYVHPTNAACCNRLIPEVADTVVEYGTDTTRAISSYVYRGAARRYPDVKMIWSHSGGTMPHLIERYDFIDRNPQSRKEAPDGFRASIARFWYDIAQASNPVATSSLRQVVPVERIVFGTDYPFRTSLEHVKGLEEGKVFNRRELTAIYRTNVEATLPEIV